MHGGIGLRPDFGVNFGFLGPRRRFDGHAACRAQFVGPQRYRRQGGSRVVTGSHRLHQRALKGIPHHQQLGF